jgi:HAMP domain-containing protein
MALAVRILGALDEERFALGTVLVLAVVAVPIALSVITWKWLGGREERPK